MPNLSISTKLQFSREFFLREKRCLSSTIHYLFSTATLIQNHYTKGHSCYEQYGNSPELYLFSLESNNFTYANRIIMLNCQFMQPFKVAHQLITSFFVFVFLSAVILLFALM